MTEQNLDIICACLPVCRPPLEYLFPRRFQTPTCAPKKKSMDTSDSTVKDAQRQCQYKAQSSPNPMRHCSPLEKGMPETTSQISRSVSAWSVDEEANVAEKKGHRRNCTQVTSPPKTGRARSEPGPGIHLVRQFGITYGNKVSG